METQVVDKILSSIDTERPSIVAICGAADLGKSYLSNKTIAELLNRGITAGFLTLDSYLLERAERIRRGVSGYQIESYDQDSILAALNNFKQQKSISYSPYDHSTGKACGESIRIDPCSVLIVDGIHSMHENVYELIDFSIFIYTNDKYLKKIRYEADLIKRGFTVGQVNNNSDHEFFLYKTMIAPYRKKADLKLYLVEKWKYHLE